MLFFLYRFRNSFLRKIIHRIIIKIDGGEMWSLKLRELYKKHHNVEIGIGSYGGCFNYNNIPSGTKIGRYCSFAKNIYIYPVNHPKECVTTHPMIFNPVVGFVKNDFRSRTILTIGNDVWIGQNSIILPNVSSIADGAIIGAGSVVTKNVDAYSIVAGNPAKVISYRFNKETISKLQIIKWWNWSKDDICKDVNILTSIDKFLSKHS